MPTQHREYRADVAGGSGKGSDRMLTNARPEARNRGTSVRGGTDTGEQLEEDREDVTEFSGHGNCSFIEGVCRSAVTYVTR